MSKSAKSRATAVAQPSMPRRLSEWEAGTWAEATPAKVKYEYCKHGVESLASIAETLSGRATGNTSYPTYCSDLTWEDLALLNYATKDPEEINYYLEKFNGCGWRVTADQKNYIFDARDDRPWIWVPAIPAVAPTQVHIVVDVGAVIVLPSPHDEVSKAVLEIFDAVDAKGTKTGVIMKREIDLALGDPQFTGGQAAALVTMKKNVSDWRNFSSDSECVYMDPETSCPPEIGITRADVMAYERLVARDPKSVYVLRNKYLFEYASGKIKKTTRTLLNGMPDPLAVCQGDIGDCWFLAAIVGLASIPDRRESIKEMISVHGAGQYTVAFPGIKKRISVTEPTDAEIALFSTAEDNGLWLVILEKSFGAAVNRDTYFFVTSSDYDAANSLGSLNPLAEGIRIMTGNSVDFDVLALTSSNELRDKLLTARRNGKVVTAGIRANLDFWSDNDARENGLPMGHAYTVMGYDAAKDVLRVRNPWGFGGAHWPPQWVINQGVFEMSMQDFHDSFSTIAFEE
jgi:hypothetical protein